MTTTKKRLEQMHGEMVEAGRQAVIDLAGAFTEAVRTTAEQLHAVAAVASERLAAEQEEFAEDLQRELQTRRQAGECGHFGRQVAAYGDVLRDLAERRRQLGEAKATADPVQRVLVDIELRGLAARQARLMLAAGASQAEAEAATALPPREALAAPVAERPQGQESDRPVKVNGNGRKKAATKE
jgi:hypothetical protein